MLEHPHQFRSENLPQYRWETFFEELLQSHQGRPVNLLQGSDFLNAQIPEEKARLSNITYDPSHGGILTSKGLVKITSDGPDGQSVSMEEPNIVWIYYNVDNDMIGIEIINEENSHLILRFA